MVQLAPFLTICEGESLKQQLKCLGDVFSNPDLIPNVFTDDYEQIADGQLLNRIEFEAEVRHVKANTQWIRFVVLDAVRQGDQLAVREVVETGYSYGRPTCTEVYLFATLRGGRFARVNEVTRPLKGDKAMRDIGLQINTGGELTVKSVGGR